MASKGSRGKKRMTQSEVVKHFSETTGMKRAEVKQVKTSGEFVLPGFGKLTKAERKARQGRNPATGETIQIPAKTALKFRVSKGLTAAALPGRPGKPNKP
jgi:DNA-binding protein HU-beta